LVAPDDSNRPGRQSSSRGPRLPACAAPQPAAR